MTSVAVIGQGFVGGSLTTVLAERGLDVFVYDKSWKRAPGAAGPPNAYKGPINSVSDLVQRSEDIKHFSRIYFVCLPTPMKSDGSCDLSIVDGVLTELSKIPGERIAVVKSTVPPGSTDNWNKKFQNTGLTVIFCPEFLTEANALNDMRNQDRIILGGPRPHINRVKELFMLAFPQVPIHKTSAVNAEMVKYTINTFLTTKVLFANEMYQICEKLSEHGFDSDYDRIVELATLDKRLGTSHWKVPGPMPADDGSGRLLRGVSGSCFVKDLNSLIFFAKQLGIDPKVLSAVWQKNLEVRPERDWEKLLGRAVSQTEDNKNVGEQLQFDFIVSEKKN